MSKKGNDQGVDLETKAKIIRKYGTQRRFCQAAGIPEDALSNYLNRVRPWRPEHEARAEKCLSD